MSFRAIFVVLFVCLSGPSLLAQTCTSVSLSPNTGTARAAGDNLTFTASGTPTNCLKTPSSDVPWITVSFGGGTANPSTIGITVAANPSSQSRVGTVSVNGVPFTVTQSGITCSYSVGQQGSANIGSAAGSGTINLSAPTGCNWTATSNDSWVRPAETSGSGSAAITYNYDANTTPASRTASIQIGTASFTITQAAACSLTLNPNSQSINASSNTGTFAVTANVSSCSRTAVSDSTWLTISSGTTGTGNGTVAWTAAVNNTPNARTGRITVGDTVFTLQQAGGTCIYLISPATATAIATGGSGTFNLTTACTWQVSSNATWLTVTSDQTGTGSALVSWAAGANPSAQARTASITIGSAAFTVSQTAASCDVNLSQAAFNAPAEGITTSIEINTNAGCNWTATTSVSWITFQSAAVGTGDSALSFAIAANVNAATRTGTVLINNKVLTITQVGQNCTVAISPTTASAPSSGASGSIAVTTNCAWTARSSAAWLTLTATQSGTGNGQVDYAAAVNPGAAIRTATIAINGQVFTVTQSGGSCTLSLTTAATQVPARATTGRFNVQGSAGCTWEPVSDSTWLTLPSFSLVNGSGAVDFAASANPTGAPRSATIKVGSETFAVTQAGSVPTISLNGIVNAASYTAGISPGLIVAVFGTFLGPQTLATAQLSSDGRSLTKDLQSAQILFDGVPGAMIYSSATQASVVVPYAVAGKTSSKVTVQYQGITSPEVTVAVTPTAPAIFTLDQSGKGQGAVLNENFTVNGATNAAARNSIIQVFATGEGVTNPAGVDGKLAVAPLPAPTATITARIGNIVAPIIYAGAAPGLVAGAIQINIRVPLTAPVGAAVPLVINMGTPTTQANVTIAVR